MIWQAESDPFCREVLRRHWPEAERFYDVRQIDERCTVPEILCGGFPCQDISLAGSGAGLSGSRSGLWFEFARVIRILRPSIVLIENVPALRLRGLCVVLQGLASSGYDAQWDCIPASACGAPHGRDRIFVVAWRVSDPDRNGVRLSAERGGDTAQAPKQRYTFAQYLDARMADAASKGRQGPAHERTQQRPSGDQLDGCDLPQWPPAPDDLHAWGAVPAHAQPAVCGVAHGLPDRVDRLRALGNAVVPVVAEAIGRAILDSQR